MRVLFLLMRLPNLDYDRTMYSELIEEFKKNNIDVDVVAVANDGIATCLKTERGISVLRVQSLPLFGNTKILKAIAMILLPFCYYYAISRFLPRKKYDLLITPTPPITLGWLLFYLKKKYCSSVYLILRDFFPQSAVDLGLISKYSPIFFLFRSMERQLYKTADHIGCMSPKNIKFLKEKNSFTDKKDLHILENFQKYEPLQSLNNFTWSPYDLTNKFIAIYGGNFGVPQELENILALAQKIEIILPDVSFVLIGRGTELMKIKSLIKKRCIKNVILLESVPKKEFEKLVAASQLGIVSLNRKFTTPNIPSKAITYWSQSLPVIASVNEGTDFDQVLLQHECGLCSLAGDLDQLLKNFIALYSNEDMRKKFGQNGRVYFEQNLTTRTAFKRIISCAKSEQGVVRTEKQINA